MRHSRAADWCLVAALLPAYLAIQAYAAHEYRAVGGYRLPFLFSGAQGSTGHPVVLERLADGSTARVGDVLLRVGNVDLQGLTGVQVARASAPLLSEGRSVVVHVARRGAPLALKVEPLRERRWWPIPAYASLALAGAFLLLRAPHWHLSRRFFLASMFSSITLASGLVWHDPVLFVVMGLTRPIAIGLILWTALDMTTAARPLPRWWRLLPWVFAAGDLVSRSALSLLTLPVGRRPLQILLVNSGLFLSVTLLAVVRAYRRAGALERRQVRWVAYGFGVGLLPEALWTLGRAVGLEVFGDDLEQISRVFFAAIPLGIVISVVGYQWLDIDRLITASATLTVIGISLLGAALAVIPPLARAASAALQVDPEAGRLALSMAFAAVLVPAYRGLRPWLDRRMFAEHHELAQRFEHLRSELGACRGVEELVTRAGEGLDALPRPDSIATYARSGDAFTPLFVRGHAAPPAFEARSTLVQVLEAKGAPLFARAKQLGPFERAALETLGAEVVVPVRQADRLLAFTCLATKRSGDIYTLSDLLRLGALAERCAEVIARIDADEITREAQAMQLALRRFVPGAVAERVLRGDALDPAEREVSVLFVEIRDYTRATGGLRPSEVFATLNEHTERVSRIVKEYGGTIVEFNGDGMMAVFGAPEALARKERQAVEAARRVVDSMPAGLAVGVGIATGDAFVGSIRSSDRLIWSAVGSTTNLASRLQSLTRELSASIALDETTRERAGYVCADFARQEVAIRGRVGRFDVFTLPLRAATVPSA